MNNYIDLSASEKKILESYKSVLDGLSEYMGAGYEILLHSLENLDHSVIKVINGHYSGRTEGAPITDLALTYLSKIEAKNENHHMTYYNKKKNGGLIRSATIAIPGDNQRIIGLICINFYLDTPLSSILDSFTFNSEAKKDMTENFATNANELINNAIVAAKSKVYNDTSISSINKNKEIISLLYEEGVFNFKDAVVYVAKSLSISKNTVYMHMRKLDK